MNNIEDLIRENKEMFMDEEPMEGHFGRFEAKLRQQKRKNQLRNLYRVTSIAAIGLALIASSIFIYDRFYVRDSSPVTLGDINPELGKVEYYFTSQIDEATISLDSLRKYSDEGTQKMIDREFAELDSLHTQLTEKLGTNPNDERIINGLITYYQTKLKIMEHFITTLNQIKQIKNQNNQNYESTVL
jgi:hypothetical protein